jgi:hypothetical protein
MRGNNWLLSLHSESSEEKILTTLQHSGEKVYADSALIVFECTKRIEKKKVAILHLKKSIRKVQIDRTLLNLKIESQKLFGTLDLIKDSLQRKGYSQFRRTISGSSHKTRPYKKSMQLTLKYSAQLAEHAHNELLDCLKKDAEIDIAGCTELPQTVMEVRKTMKTMALETKMLFTNIEDLKDDIQTDSIRIEALKRQNKNLKTMYEAKFQAQQDRYAELHQQFEHLRARCNHIEKREAETMSESRRRIEKRTTQGVDA